MSIFRQPLVHFLGLGLLLFLLFELTTDSAPDLDKTIVVDRQQLLKYLQIRSKSLARQESVLDSMNPRQLQELVDAYVQEESLYRESLSLGLDANDYMIRQRLVQKVEYLAAGAEPPAQPDYEKYYEENKDSYYIKPTLTFTHIFINRENHESAQAAREAAMNLLEEVRQRGTDFSGAMQFGDRFAFHKNYVDRSEDFIASHFGDSFAEELTTAESGKWVGPVESAYGYHLVLIREHKAGRTPPLEEIMNDVAYDADQAASRARTEAAVRDIVASYNVIIDL